MDRYKEFRDVRVNEGVAVFGNLFKSVILVGYFMGGFVVRVVIVYLYLWKLVVEIVVIFLILH